jgi:predicted MarR family transcription regulator
MFSSSKRPAAVGSVVTGEAGRRRIVSSAHLVSDKAAELSEVEYGLIVASNAFGLWTVRGTAAALAEFPDIADLGVIDILCLHSVNHRGRAKKLADICFKLNVEDTHIVNYALKKLIKAGLIAGQKQGKEVLYSTTERGRALIERYTEIREACLVDAFSALGEVDAESLADLARRLRALSGLYGQAARSATNL